MRRPWRLTKISQKVLFVVIGYAVFATGFFLLRTWVLNQNDWPYAVVGGVFNVGYVLVAVRIFRGYLEPVDPPRAWWRWTGRPTAGFWLGWLHVFALLGVCQVLWLPDKGGFDLAAFIANVATTIIPAVGYLNSSFRLRLHPELWSQKRGRPAATV